MPDATDRFWARMQRKAAALQPEMQRDFLRGLSALRARFEDPVVRAALATGDFEQALAIALTDAAVAVAFSRYRARVQVTTQRAVADFGKDIPGIAPTVGISFDVLNPKVVEAVKALDTAMLQDLATGTRETVRQHILAGIEQGVNPRETARGLRDVLGLSPTQEAAVRHFREALEAGDTAKALGYGLRDRRFDGTVRKGDLTTAQIDRMADAYRRKMIAFNAETNARTATLDALKLGQQLSWQEAMDKGFVPRGALWKQWKGVLDDREREEHLAMEGETVPFDQPYSNGEMVPGESTYNCRCVSIVFARAA